MDWLAQLLSQLGMGAGGGSQALQNLFRMPYIDPDTGPRPQFQPPAGGGGGGSFWGGGPKTFVHSPWLGPSRTAYKSPPTPGTPKPPRPYIDPNTGPGPQFNHPYIDPDTGPRPEFKYR